LTFMLKSRLRFPNDNESPISSIDNDILGDKALLLSGDIMVLCFLYGAVRVRVRSFLFEVGRETRLVVDGKLDLLHPVSKLIRVENTSRIE
jgi:hypothetical protein